MARATPMDLLYTLVFAGTMIGLWRRVAVVMAAQGRGWFFRNWIGATIGAFVAIGVTLLASADSGIVSVAGFALAVGCAAAPWWTNAGQPAPALDGVPPVPAAAVTPSTLDALGTISFDYVDARGKDSHRTVDVTAVDSEYLEGFCHTAAATRTFVIGRVRGEVLDLTTGELLPARQWVASVLDDPRNGIVSMAGDSRSEAPGDGEAVASSCIEILFTGFPKAQREDLESTAVAAGMTVRRSVTRGLDYLCAGPKAGPAKMEQAGDVGAIVIDAEGFFDLVKN